MGRLSARAFSCTTISRVLLTREGKAHARWREEDEGKKTRINYWLGLLFGFLKNEVQDAEEGSTEKLYRAITEVGM